jgi:DNA processing protein
MGRRQRIAVDAAEQEHLELRAPGPRHTAPEVAWAQLEALGVRPRHRGEVEAAGGPVALLSRSPEALAAWLSQKAARRRGAFDAGEIGRVLARVRQVLRPFLSTGGTLLSGPEQQRRLARAADPRLVLFGCGPAAILDGPRSVAIVGTRRASKRGERRAQQLARALADRGVVVVSGGADGIDRAAHQGAIDGGGATIEVVGERLGAKPAPRHGRIALVDGRLLKIIVFGPGEAQGRWLFARRNRFIAAAADALVVVEGGERSGARYAAEAALALGLPVRVFPGDIDEPDAGLANKLLAETDARPMRSLAELLEAAEGTVARSQRRPSATWRQPHLPLQSARGGAERLPALLEALRAGPRTVDELAAALGSPPGEVQQQALDWELRGRVERVGGRLQLMAR